MFWVILHSLRNIQVSFLVLSFIILWHSLFINFIAGYDWLPSSTGQFGELTDITALRPPMSRPASLDNQLPSKYVMVIMLPDYWSRKSRLILICNLGMTKFQFTVILNFTKLWNRLSFFSLPKQIQNWQLIHSILSLFGYCSASAKKHFVSGLKQNRLILSLIQTYLWKSNYTKNSKNTNTLKNEIC